MELSEFFSAGVETFDWVYSTWSGSDAGVGAALFLVGIDVFSFADGVFVEGGLTLDPSYCFEAAVFEATALEGEALEVEALEAAGLGAVDLEAGEAFTGFLR